MALVHQVRNELPHSSVDFSCYNRKSSDASTSSASASLINVSRVGFSLPLSTLLKYFALMPIFSDSAS